MKTIAVVNQKGGVGKTVSAVNIAVGLAGKGERVLAIDLDPQGSLSVSLGQDDPDTLQETISNIMKKMINEEPFDKRYAILEHEEGIDFIPANLQLAGFEMELFGITMGREALLLNYLDTIKDDYDFVIIDCSPSLGMLTINALACANEVIIPVQAHYLSIKGMEQLFDTIKKVKQKRINERLHVAGILITMVDSRLNSSKDIIEHLENMYGGDINIFNSRIPMSVKAIEMSIDGKSIYQYDPKGKLALAYQEVVEELLVESNCEVK